MIRLLFPFYFVMSGLAGYADAPAFRPPAVPLVVCDPYFSIWSNADRLTDVPTTHWTGAAQRLTSLVRIDGKTFRVMGDAPSEIPALRQTSVSVLPTRTIYQFSDAGIDLSLTFMTPVLPDDLKVLSRPVTYLTWQVKANDGKTHQVFVYFEATGEVVVNKPDQKVTWSREHMPGLAVVRMGSEAQPLLKQKGDDVRIGWGYLYAATPVSESPTISITGSDTNRQQFVSAGKLTETTDTSIPTAVNSGAPVIAESLDFGPVTSEAATRYTLMAYDEIYGVSYFWTKLRPYWRAQGAEPADLLKLSAEEYPELVQRCTAFDNDLMSDLKKVGGDDYAKISALAYRQAFGACGLVADSNGQPLLIPKENTSNGCMATTEPIDTQWLAPDFDDTAWSKGPAGFGNKDPVRAKWRKNWDWPDIWLRREFILPSGTWKNMRLWIHHIDSVEVYINGIEAFTEEKALDGYDAVLLDEKAQESIKAGKNTIALHCHYGGNHGRQFVDTGLVDLQPNSQQP